MPFILKVSWQTKKMMSSKANLIGVHVTTQKTAQYEMISDALVIAINFIKCFLQVSLTLWWQTLLWVQRSIVVAVFPSICVGRVPETWQFVGWQEGTWVPIHSTLLWVAVSTALWLTRGRVWQWYLNYEKRKQAITLTRVFTELSTWARKYYHFVTDYIYITYIRK